MLSKLIEADYQYFFEMFTAPASHFEVFLPEDKEVGDFKEIAAIAKFGHIIYQAKPFNRYLTSSNDEGYLVFETLKREYGVSLFRQ